MSLSSVDLTGSLRLEKRLRLYHTPADSVAMVIVCKQVLVGLGTDAMHSVFAADASAFKASRPKLPIPGQRNILVRENTGRMTVLE